MNNNITIVDYGCGNSASIRNMLKKIGHPSIISSDPVIIAESDKLILPGVGSFDHGMKKLEEFDLISVLNERALTHKTPILGICLGVQLFCKKSDEGMREGLGWIDAEVVKFDRERLSDSQKVPHMGWGDTRVTRVNKLIASNDEIPRYYYVHSYHLDCRDQDLILSTATHGYKFVSSIEQGNILGVQFHPEKSHRFGMALLKNFAEKY